MDCPTLDSLRSALSRPEAYDHPVGPVLEGQTHISLLFFAGARVYKLKKPVRLPFLDFSTLALRERFCHEEVRLNSRLAPRTYLGVCPIVRRADGSVHMGAPGGDVASDEELLDWAVAMRRLPSDRMLDQLLAHGDTDAQRMRELADVLTRFHAAAATGPGVDEHGTPQAVSRLVLGNLDELRPFTGDVRRGDALLTSPLLAFLRRRAASFLQAHDALLAERVAGGHIRDGHGDLHAGNICCTDEGFVIYDALEFSAAYRCADVAADLAFLCMDLDRAGFRAFSRHLVKLVRERSGDEDLTTLLPFYKTYRALVRAKVGALSVASGDLDPEASRAALALARSHVALAASYELGPCLVVLCGLPGTGKSWIARRVARGLGASLLRTDVVRKRMAGMPPASHPAGPAQVEALYGGDRVGRVYAETQKLATARLAAGGSVVVDATFSRACWRQPLLDAGVQLGAAVILVHVRCDDDEIRRRLVARRDDPAEPSDADVAVYERSLSSFEVPDEVAPALRMDVTSGEDPEDVLLATLVHTLAAQRA
jgi:aminoglycoside phosphotransferase family enzyme/predicted kinase